MKCRDLQFDLPLYVDDVLSADRHTLLSEHIVQCPLCRQKLVDFQELRSGLRASARPELSAKTLESLRSVVARRTGSRTGSPVFQLIDDRRKWLDVWLMPYAVGITGTLIVGITMMWLVVSGEIQNVNYQASSRSTSRPITRVLVPYIQPVGENLEVDLSPREYALSRSIFADESPSINPRGALVALTRSLMRGEMKDDEVVVVADVFGNGLARIAEVVEPSSDSRAIIELQKALQSDPSFAPFVPANFDQRSETIRVILKIQSVNVNTGLQ